MVGESVFVTGEHEERRRPPAVPSFMAKEHRRAAVVSMGDELTLGQTLDTNSRWISQRLVERGIVPVEHVTVPDDLKATIETLQRLARSVDVVISSGGLGPTADDLTRAALAGAMGDSLVEDPESLVQIKGWFAGRGREMPPLNAVQALRPSRGSAIENRNGTAPGLAATVGNCDVFCLPGPPSEMKPMFGGAVDPALRPPVGRTVVTRAVHTFGLGESELATRLGRLMDRDHNPLVGTTASGGVVTARIRYEGTLPPNDAEKLVAEAEASVRAAAGAYAFAAGDETQASALLADLRGRNETVCVVESCTGGLLGAMLTEPAGSSAAFMGGWITYSNAMKAAEVGVGPGLIEAKGAVSREVAEAMARGGLRTGGTTHCLAITGIAGPDGGTIDKPVGTVWIARASRAGAGTRNAEASVDVRRFKMSGDRAAIREWSAKSALAMLWLHSQGRGEWPILRQVEPAGGR